jgi:hypothetical protein
MVVCDGLKGLRDAIEATRQREGAHWKGPARHRLPRNMTRSAARNITGAASVMTSTGFTSNVELAIRRRRILGGVLNEYHRAA